MPYSQSLADRVRLALRDQRGIAEKKMFGGVGFLHRGNMLVGIWQTSLIVRLGPTRAPRRSGNRTCESSTSPGDR